MAGSELKSQVEAAAVPGALESLAEGNGAVEPQLGPQPEPDVVLVECGGLQRT